MYALIFVKEPDTLEAEPQWNEFLNKTISKLMKDGKIEEVREGC